MPFPKTIFFVQSLWDKLISSVKKKSPAAMFWSVQVHWFCGSCVVFHFDHKYPLFELSQVEWKVTVAALGPEAVYWWIVLPASCLSYRKLSDNKLKTKSLTTFEEEFANCSLRFGTSPDNWTKYKGWCFFVFFWEVCFVFSVMFQYFFFL